MTGVPALMTVESGFRPLLFVGGREAIGSAVFSWAESGLCARAVRGRKMRTLSGLFDEFAAAFQFPLYFGENWTAFDECIAELEALSAGEGHVVLITEADQVLAEAGDDTLRSLVDSLASAAAAWSVPVELGEWWDRPAVPFHVVLAVEHHAVEVVVRRWLTAGAELAPFAQN